MKNLDVFLVQDCDSWKASIQLIYQLTKGYQHKVCVCYNNWAPPPVCLPDVMHMTKSPRPSFSIFTTVSNQKLEAGTAWKQGYMHEIVIFWWFSVQNPIMRVLWMLMLLNSGRIQQVRHDCLTWVNLLLRLCEEGYSSHMAWEWG